MTIFEMIDQDMAELANIKKTFHFTFFSSPEHEVLKVSYCDRPVSGVCRASFVVNNLLKSHVLINR